jgi:hypothetical protein
MQFRWLLRHLFSLTFYLLLVPMAFSAHPAYKELEELTSRINTYRKTDGSFFMEKETQEINAVLSGNKYGLDLTKKANPEERQIAWKSVLTQHLHFKSQTRQLTNAGNNLRQLCAASVMKDIQGEYYGHTFALITMHLAAHALTRWPASCFWDWHLLHENVIALFITELVAHSSFKGLEMNKQFKEYLHNQEISEIYLQNVLGKLPTLSLITLSRDFADVPEQRIIRAYEHFQQQAMPLQPWQKILRENGYFIIESKLQDNREPEAIVVDVNKINISINDYLKAHDIATIDRKIFITLKPRNNAATVMKNFIGALEKKLKELEPMTAKAPRSTSLKAAAAPILHSANDLSRISLRTAPLQSTPLLNTPTDAPVLTPELIAQMEERKKRLARLQSHQ